MVPGSTVLYRTAKRKSFPFMEVEESGLIDLWSIIFKFARRRGALYSNHRNANEAVSRGYNKQYKRQETAHDTQL